MFSLANTGLYAFLSATVGTEPNGMTLSLMSLFARRGDDPWQEAARLAALPRAAAVDSLAQSIAHMPSSPWPLAQALPIATHLATLLPSRIGQVSAVLARPPRHLVRYALLGLALLVLIALGAGMIIGPLSGTGRPSLQGAANPPPAAASPAPVRARL